MREMIAKRLSRFLTMKNYVEDENLVAKVWLPGIKKENLQIEGGEKGFCIKAQEGGKHFESCYYIGHRVDPATTRVNFMRGQLSLRIPLNKEEIHGWTIPL